MQKAEEKVVIFDLRDESRKKAEYNVIKEKTSNQKLSSSKYKKQTSKHELHYFDKLNVGCGNKANGDVNVDLYVESTKHRSSGKAILFKAIKNFIICDANYLPFKEKSFRVAESNHVIEHLENPNNLLTEMVRVASSLVVIRCPHKLGEKVSRRKSRGHIQFFSKSWFWRFAKINDLKIEVETSKWLHIPHEYMPLFRVPLEMTVNIKLF
jgi:SAM-dependent methyltransferase